MEVRVLGRKWEMDGMKLGKLEEFKSGRFKFMLEIENLWKKIKEN